MVYVFEHKDSNRNKKKYKENKRNIMFKHKRKKKPNK